MPVLAVSLRSVRVLKGGDLAANYAQPSMSDFAPERAPKYYRDTDIDILTQLSARSTRYYYREQPKSAELLQRIVATGRAFWLSITRERRCVGERSAKAGSNGARPASAALRRISSCRE